MGQDRKEPECVAVPQATEKAAGPVCKASGEAAEKGIQIIVCMQRRERGPKSDLMLRVQTD